MRVLVTGGAGLIGHHIITELAGRGIESVSFDVAETEENRKGAISIVGDVRDIESICRGLREHRIERVIHCASMLQGSCEEKPDLAVEINADGTANILEAARREGVKRVVLASSVAVYGRTRYEPMDEAHPCEPGNIYASTKLLGEFLGRAYERRCGMEVLAIRFGLVYGPSCVRSKGVAAEFRSMLLDALTERRVKIPKVEQIVPLTYASDAALGMVLACLHAPTPLHRIYNVSGRAHKLSEVAEALCQLYPGSEIERVDGFLASPLNGALDIRLAKTELKYAPKIVMKEGIRRTCKYLEATREPGRTN